MTNFSFDLRCCFLLLTPLFFGCENKTAQAELDPKEAVEYYNSIGATLQYDESKNIVSLTLGNVRPKVSAEALKHVPQLSSLKYLDVTHTHVGDEGLRYLNGNSTITHLSMRNCGATRSCLATLASMKVVEQVEWGDNLLVENDLNEFKASRPSVKLYE